MTTPPQKLQSTLLPGVCYTLTAEDGRTLGMIEYTEAMRRAVHGEIEGVCAASGRIRYLRELSAANRAAVQEIVNATLYDRRPQPLNAKTNLGAYRQHLNVGSVWALCQCRGIDGARA